MQFCYSLFQPTYICVKLYSQIGLENVKFFNQNDWWKAAYFYRIQTTHYIFQQMKQIRDQTAPVITVRNCHGILWRHLFSIPIWSRCAQTLEVSLSRVGYLNKLASLVGSIITYDCRHNCCFTWTKRKVNLASQSPLWIIVKMLSDEHICKTVSQRASCELIDPLCRTCMFKIHRIKILTCFLFVILGLHGAAWIKLQFHIRQDWLSNFRIKGMPQRWQRRSQTRSARIGQEFILTAYSPTPLILKMEYT